MSENEKPNAAPLTEDDVRQVAQRIDAIEEKVDSLADRGDLIEEIFLNTQRIAETIKVGQAHSKESFLSISRQITSAYNEISQQLKEILSKIQVNIDSNRPVGVPKRPVRVQPAETRTAVPVDSSSIAHGKDSGPPREDPTGNDWMETGPLTKMAKMAAQEHEVDQINSDGIKTGLGEIKPLPKDRERMAGEHDVGAWRSDLPLVQIRKIVKTKVCDLSGIAPSLKVEWIQSGVDTVGDLMDALEYGNIASRLYPDSLSLLSMLGFNRAGDGK